MNGKQAKDTTQAVQRAIDLLEAVAAADGPIGTSALARQTSLSKATAHRLCQTLAARQFLEQDAQTGHYRLGTRLLRMCSHQLGRIDVARVAFSLLEKMAHAGRQNTFLGRIDESREMLICNEVRFDNAVQPRSLLGCRYTLLEAPGGLLCLTGLSEDVLASTANDMLRHHGQVDPIACRNAIERVRCLRGAAYSIQEGVPDKNTVVVCSRLIDPNGKAVGVVGYCYPRLVLGDTDPDELGRMCSQTAMSISAVLPGVGELGACNLLRT